MLTTMVGIGGASAHEEREVGDDTFEVGFLDEPVYSGQKSGVDLQVSLGGEPVEGLEETLQAEVTFEGQTRDLEISPRFGLPGAYRSVFFPTAAGPYTFHIFGEIDGEAIDETFTSGPETFSEVADVAGGQFPVQYRRRATSCVTRRQAPMRPPPRRSPSLSAARACWPRLSRWD